MWLSRNSNSSKSIFSILWGACSDNMGNKESKVGIFFFNDGINLSRFPIVEVVKEVFLLYQMNRIPIIMVLKPVSTNRANISFW